MAVQYNPGIVTDGLVLYVDAANRKCYSGVGLTGSDLSTVNNTIQLINGITFSGTSNSFVFDGFNDYINCGNNASLQLNSAFSINVAFNATAWDKGWQAIVTKGDNSYRVHRFSASTPAQIAFGTNGLSILDSTSNATFSTGVNYIVTCVYTGSQKIIYVNGVADKTDNVTGTLTQDTTFNVAIGENLQPTSRYFGGSIYLTQIYNRALNASEVLQNFNALRGRFGI